MPHQVPAEGLDHPAFATLNPTDDVRVHLYFRDALNDTQYTATEHLLRDWLAQTDWTRDAYQAPIVADVQDSKVDLYFRLQHSKHPAAALAALVQRLETLGVDVQERVYTRWVVIDPATGLMSPFSRVPLEDARGDFDDQAAYMQFLFGENLDVASENPLHLKGYIPLGENKGALEQRSHVLGYEDLRLGYGICEHYQKLAADDRTEAIEQTLQAAIKERFATAWGNGAPPLIPTPMNFAREEGRLDTIYYDGRRGYEFLLFARTLEVMVRQGFRQREEELFDAVRATIKKTDLGAVVGWIRVSRPVIGMLAEPIKYYVQLWEKPGAHLPAQAPAMAPELEWPPTSIEAFAEEWLGKVAGHFHHRRKDQKLAERLAEWHGAKLPADLARMLTVRSTRSFNGHLVGDLVCDDGDVVLPDEPVENAFLACMNGKHRRQLFDLFCLQLSLGTLNSSGLLVVASLQEKSSGSIYVIQQGSFLAAPSWSELLHEMKLFEHEDGLSLVPLPTEKTEVASVIESRRQRNLWLWGLLGIDNRTPQECAQLALAWCKHVPGLGKSVENGNLVKLATTGMYLLWQSFFVDHPALGKITQLLATHPARIVRDSATLVDELRNGRKDLGPLMPDVHAKRAEFLSALAPELRDELRAASL